MKYRQYNPNAKFSMLNQRDGIDEDYSDRENGEESCLNPRRLLGLCLCCSCVLLLPLLTAAFFLNSWATDAVEAAGMQTFGVPTSVGSVEISPLSARWSLSDLEVASPPGFGQYSFLTLGSGVFDLSFRSVIFNPLQLQELTLQDVHLNIDQHVDGSSNAKSIMEHITKASASAQSKQFNEVIMTKKVIVDKISFSNIVTRLCLHPSCEMSPPPYFVIKKVEVSDVGKKEGGVYVPDLLQVIVRAVVVAAIRAAPHQLGNPLAESLGAGLLQALDYAQIHYDLGAGLETASAQIGVQMGRLSHDTAALGQGVASTLQRSQPEIIQAIDKALGLDHPADAQKKEVQQLVNQNAATAAGSFASAVSNFSKMLSQGERAVGSNVSSILAAVGDALQNEKPMAAGQEPAKTELPEAAGTAMKDFSTMLRGGEQVVGKMLKQQQSEPNGFNPLDVFKKTFEQGESAASEGKSPLDVFGNMLAAATPPPR